MHMREKTQNTGIVHSPTPNKQTGDNGPEQNRTEQSMVVYALILALGGRGRRKSECETSFVCIASSRTAKAT